MKEEEKENLHCECDCAKCFGCGEFEENDKQAIEEGEGVLTFLDEDGKEVRFDILDVVSLEDKEYLVVMPISGIELNEEEEGNILILEIKQENGEEVYDTVVDDEIAEKVFEKFQEEYGDDDDDYDDDYDDEDESGCNCDDCDCHDCGTDGCD